MKRWTYILILGLLCVQTSYCGTDTITLSVENGDCSNYQILDVNKHNEYIIMWNGGDIPSFCTFGFDGQDSVVLNQYKVCVEATTYEVNDCNVEVKYEPTSFSQYKTYSCNDFVPKYCTDSDSILDIEFDTKFIQPMNPNAGKVKLLVTGHMTYNSTLVIGLVSGFICLTVILSVISGVICRARRRARAAHETVYAQPEGISNPILHPPPVNSTNYNSLPPSYEQTMSNSGGKMG